MSVLETLKAISHWKIDAVDDDNPDAVYVADHRVDAFLEDPPSFLLGKKGTGKTAFATKLQSNFPDNVFYVTFRDLLPTYQEIQRHQKDPNDFETKVVAVQLAACLSALSCWAKQTRRKVTLKRWQSIFDRVQRPAYFPTAIAAVASMLVRSKKSADGDEEAEVRLDFNRFKFHLNRPQLLRDYLAKVLREVKRKDGEVFLFIDGIDDLQEYSHHPFDKDAASLLRAFIYATFFWDHGVERPIHLVGMLRPEFLGLANLQNLKPKIEDDALRLEWTEESLFEMLSHRIDTDVEASMTAAAKKAAYFRRIGTRQLFGRDETEHKAIVNRLFVYGFLRPRDLIRYTKFAADYAIKHGDPHKPLALTYFDKVVGLQQDYLLDEMKAELAVTLPEFERFVQCLAQLQADADGKIFVARLELEKAIQNVIAEHSIDIDSRTVLARLYAAFAIGYRGTGASRHFAYAGGAAKLPEGNQITLHDVFREKPIDRVLVEQLDA